MNTALENTGGPAPLRLEGEGGVTGDNPSMSISSNENQTLVLFRLGQQRYALRLSAVDRVIRAVAVTPVPETPAFVLGLINMAGQLLPVCSLRSCLGLPERALRPEDLFVITRTARLPVALMVDDVSGLVSLNAAQTVAPEIVLPGRGCRVEVLVKLDDNIILIYDLDKLFTQNDQERILQAQVSLKM